MDTRLVISGVIAVIGVALMVVFKLSPGRPPTEADKEQQALRQRRKEVTETVSRFPAGVAVVMMVGGVLAILFANSAIHEIEGILAFGFGLVVVAVVATGLGTVAAIHRLRHAVEDQAPAIEPPPAPKDPKPIVGPLDDPSGTMITCERLGRRDR